MKNLTLSPYYFIKGTEENTYLHNIKSGDLFKLTANQYRVILKIAKGINQKKLLDSYPQKEKENVKKFLDNLKDIGALNHGKGRNFTQLSKEPHLQSVHWEITGKCNLKCKHCYQENFLGFHKDLTKEKIFQIIDQMEKLNVLKVSISGGEPLLRNDLIEIIERLEAKGIRIAGILSNGLLINKKIINDFKNLKTANHFFISFDGFYKNNMDIRAVGVSENFLRNKIIKNVKMLLKNNFEVTINTSVHKNNFRDLSKNYKRLKNMGVKTWRIGIPRLIGRYKKNYAEFDINPTELLEEFYNVTKLFIEDFKLNKDTMALQIENFFKLSAFKQENIRPFYYVCDYEGKMNSCCIKPDGIVTPCPVLVDHLMGDLKKKFLEEIWYSKKMQNIKRIKVDDIEDCRVCEFKKFCGGGCRATCYTYCGSLYHKDPLSCMTTEFIIKRVIPLLNKNGFNIDLSPLDIRSK